MTQSLLRVRDDSTCCSSTIRSRTVVDDHSIARLFHMLCSVQGLYFLATGIWPLVSIETPSTASWAKTIICPPGVRPTTGW